MKNSNKAIFIAGDTNLNLTDYETNIKVKSYLNLLFQKNFISVINEPTRVSRSNATIIDHINTNHFLNNYMHSGIITADISDHFPIFLISKYLMLDSSNEPILITKREINDKSIAYFKTLLSIVDWKHVLNENSPNNAYNEFLKKILGGLCNEAFPKQKIKIKRKSFNSPWMTKGLVQSSKKKQRLYEKFLKNRNPEKELNYKQYKTLFESLKKKSKKNYYLDLIDSHKYNIKKTWNIMKEIIGNKRVTNAPLPNFITVKNREIFDKTEIAETFNSYFVNIGPNLAASIPESKTSFQNYIHYNGPCLSTINLTDLKLENAFASLKKNKSSGYDDIDVAKRVSGEIFVILKHIFNISLAKEVFPDKLKIARVTPIFKKGNNTLVTNYRPILVLPCFSELLERIMYNRLYKFLLENNILYQKQFGFQNVHSTEHAILQLVNQITEAFSQGKYTLGNFS